MRLVPRSICVVLAVLLALPLAAQTVSTGAPALVDSQGQFVGSVISHQVTNDPGSRFDVVETALFVDGVPAFVSWNSINPDLLIQTVPSGQLWFESTDCTGTAYLVPAVVDRSGEFKGATQPSSPTHGNPRTHTE